MWEQFYGGNCNVGDQTLNFNQIVCLQVTIDIVNAELSSSEEQNVTESAKTYKVNCDKRNVTEMDNIAVQVLNSSQVILLNLSSNFSIFTVKHNRT